MEISSMSRILPFVFLAASAACGSGDPSSAGATATASEGTTSAMPLYSRTIVRLNKDGTSTATNVLVSQAQRESESRERAAAQAARASGARVFEPDISQVSCAGSDIWLYTSASCSSSSRGEICFYGAGTANMSNYQWCNLRPPLYCTPGSQYWTEWTDSVRSYWPGTEYGYFYGVDGDVYGDEHFTSPQSCTPAGTWAYWDSDLTLSD